MQLKLSKRLLQVSSYLPKGAVFADIGSDHAYLPCHVCLHDLTARAIAGEVNEGPYYSAKETVRSYGLDQVIDVRLGDGLSILKQSEVDHLVIAGMGGSLIKRILSNDDQKLERVERIIAQPNIDERDVRLWMMEHSYVISHEFILEENGHTYEIIVGDKHAQNVAYTDKELLFGPLLLKQRAQSFYNKWRSEQQKRERIIQQLKMAKARQQHKIELFEKELTWIKEVLENEKDIDKC